MGKRVSLTLKIVAGAQKVVMWCVWCDVMWCEVLCCVNPSSSPFRRDMHGTFNAFPCSRGVLHGMGPSWWCNWESTEHRSSHCFVFELCLKVVSMFRMYCIQYLSASMSYSWGIVCLGVISQTSKNSMFPMLEIISFDCSLNGLNARFGFKSLCNASLFGCVSNWWINFWTAPLRMRSCFWTAEWSNPSILKSISPRQVS